MIVLIEILGALTVLGVIGGGGAFIVNDVKRVRSQSATKQAKQRTQEGIWEVYARPNQSGGMSVGIEHPALGNQELQVFTRRDVGEPDFAGMLTEAESSADLLAYQLNVSLLRQKKTSKRIKKQMRDN